MQWPKLADHETGNLRVNEDKKWNRRWTGKILKLRTDSEEPVFGKRKRYPLAEVIVIELHQVHYELMIRFFGLLQFDFWHVKTRYGLCAFPPPVPSPCTLPP